MFTSQSFSQNNSFFLPSSVLTAAFSLVLLVAVFAFHCHRWRQEAWTTGKYWILFHPLGMWSNWLLPLKWGTTAVCSSWSLLTVSISGNSPAASREFAVLTKKMFIFLMLKWFPLKYHRKIIATGYCSSQGKAAFLLAECIDWCGWIRLFYHLRTDVVEEGCFIV